MVPTCLNARRRHSQKLPAEIDFRPSRTTPLVAPLCRLVLHERLDGLPECRHLRRASRRRWVVAFDEGLPILSRYLARASERHVKSRAESKFALPAIAGV